MSGGGDEIIGDEDDDQNRVFSVIDPTTADEGSALLSSAIAELSENVGEEAVTMHKDGLTVWVMRADRLEALGLDLATLARAMGVLARRGEPPAE